MRIYVYKCEDEWFFISISKDRSPIWSYYKCDGMNGVKELLDFFNKKKYRLTIDESLIQDMTNDDFFSEDIKDDKFTKSDIILFESYLSDIKNDGKHIEGKIDDHYFNIWKSMDEYYFISVAKLEERGDYDLLWSYHKCDTLQGVEELFNNYLM